jgi:hypothetical protein
MTLRGSFPTITELKDMGKRKEDRIRGLVPRFQYGKVFFKCKEERFDDADKLIEQLLTFPMSKHDDLMDSLSYIQDIAFIPTISAEDSKDMANMTPDEARFYRRQNMRLGNKSGFGNSNY